MAKNFTRTRYAVIRMAREYKIELSHDDFDADNTIDGMSPFQWLEAMTMD